MLVLLATLDASVALVAKNVTAEPPSMAKIIAALGFQAVAFAVLLFFIGTPREVKASVGPLKQFRAWAAPYFLFAFAVAFSLTLLYNAVACGEQSFLHSRRGEVICKS